MQQRTCNTLRRTRADGLGAQADSKRAPVPWVLRSASQIAPRRHHLLSTVDSIMATASAPSTSNLVSENGGRPTGRPKVSVVFNATDAEDDATLHERSNRWKHLDIEVVIVSSDRAAASGRQSSDARLVYAPVDSSHTQRRALGLAAASGDLVIMVDASQRPDDGWIAQLAGDGSAAGVQAQL